MISDITQIVGVVVVIASLLLLLRQTRALTLQTRMNNAIGVSTTHHASISILHGAWRVVLDYPELRPYFYDSKRCPENDPCRTRALIVAEMVADAIEYGLVITHLVPGTTTYGGGWVNYVPFAMDQPVLREVILAHPEWFPVLTRHLAENMIPTLEAE